MGIVEASWGQIILVLTCFVMGALGAGLWTTGLWRKCRKLEIRVIDLEQAHLQLRNKGYANKRWSNQEQLEAEFAQLGLGTKPPAARQRFANDPPEF